MLTFICPSNEKFEWLCFSFSCFNILYGWIKYMILEPDIQIDSVWGFLSDQNGIIFLFFGQCLE